jgi:transmembrane protein TMEM43
MPDSFSVTSNQSWFSRLFGSIKSVLVGLIFFVGAFPLLWWNEGRAVRTARSLSEGAGSIVSSPADSIDASKEGKLVHMSGAVTTEQPVVDDELAVQVQGVKLLRNVEMYQWAEEKKSETRKKLGGGEETVTTYSYKKDWASGRTDSSQFQHPEGHENPETVPFESKTFVADPVKVGAHKLSAEQIGKLNETEELPLQPAARDALSSDLQEKIQVAEGKFYMGEDPATPALGDVRISYQVVKPSAVSLAAVQTGDTFAAFQAAAGDQILLVETGTRTAAEMFKKAQDQNAVLTWILRGVGFFVMFLGIFMVFRPIAVFADVIPLFGTMLGAGIGFFAFLGAAALSFLTIAIAWVFVRPVLGITLVVIAIGALFWLMKVGRRKKAARAAGTAPALAPNAAT